MKPKCVSCGMVITLIIIKVQWLTNRQYTIFTITVDTWSFRICLNKPFFGLIMVNVIKIEGY